MQGVCEVLDKPENDNAYSDALRQQRELVEQPDMTPSARMLASMSGSDEGFFDFAFRMSQQHQAHFQSIKLSNEKIDIFDEQVKKSLQTQIDQEQSDNKSFSDYLANYFSQSLNI